MKRLAAFFLVALLVLPGLAQAKIFLADTDDTLRVVTASGVTTIHMYAAWADLTTTALTPGNSDAQVTTATTTVLVAAPAASTQRQIKGLTIRNSHASSSNVITVEFFDGATATELIQYTLLAGETLQWGEDENFRVIDASGQVKGLVAATQSGTWNITNVSGTISLPTGAATAANQDGIIKDGTGDTTQANVSNGRLQVENYNANLAADNSTLSTSKVPVLPGTVSTSAPTWTNGNQSALSLQTDGSVRAAVTNTVTVSASNLDVQIGGSDSLTIGTFPDNEPFNVAQMNGVAVSMGVGASGTGTQRVAALIHDGTDTALVSAAGALSVECGNCSGSGATHVDNAAFTGGTDDVAPMGALYDTTPPTITDGSLGAPRMDSNRYLYVDCVVGCSGGATTPSDNFANPTTAGLATDFLMLWDGATWDRAPGNSTDGLLVNLGANNDVTVTSGTVTSLTQMNGQAIAMGTGTRSAGTQRVTIATDDVVPASQSGTWTVQPGNTANTTPWLTSPIPATSGGTSVCYITSAATTNATNCKASAGQLYGFDLVNTTGTIYYLRLYNLSSSPTCSSATGFVRTIPIPASTTGAGIARSLLVGEAYGTGLGFCLTGGGSSTDNTSAATGVYVSINYK